MVKKISIVLIAIMLSSCATITFKDPDGPLRNDAPYDKKWADLFLGAFGDERFVTKCPSGQKVTQTQTYFSPGNFAVGFFTFGIYTPRTIKYWCSIEKE